MAQTRHILAELDQRRKELGMSFRILAHQSGLGPATVQRVLRGQSGERFETILKIAEALGVGIGIVKPRRVTAVRRDWAKMKAGKIVALAQGSAALESQAINDVEIKRISRKIEDSLLADTNIRLWA